MLKWMASFVQSEDFDKVARSPHTYSSFVLGYYPLFNVRARDHECSVKINPSAPSILYLMFADDLMVLEEASHCRKREEVEKVDDDKEATKNQPQQ